MKVFASILTVTTLSLAPLHAGDWALPVPSTPAPEPAADTQALFGAPQLSFGRNAAESDLPGYSFVTASWLHQFDSDFDTLAGEVSVDDFSAWVPVAPLNFGDIHLIAMLGYRATQFDTSVPNLLTEDTLHAIRMPIIFLNDSFNDWLWGGMIMPSFSGDLSSSDNFSIAAAFGAGYAFSPTLKLFGGVYYSHGFGEDTVIPGIQFTWRPSPKWEAYFLGPMGGVTYSINEDLLISAFGQYDSPTWHVEADNLGPARDIQVSSMRVGLKLERRLNDLCWGYVAGGYSFAREMDIENLNDVTLQKDDIDSGPFLQLGLNLRY